MRQSAYYPFTNCEGVKLEVKNTESQAIKAIEVLLAEQEKQIRKRAKAIEVLLAEQDKELKDRAENLDRLLADIARN
jgi:hypothetical protein